MPNRKSYICRTATRKNVRLHVSVCLKFALTLHSTSIAVTIAEQTTVAVTTVANTIVAVSTQAVTTVVRTTEAATTRAGMKTHANTLSTCSEPFVVFPSAICA